MKSVRRPATQKEQRLLSILRAVSPQTLHSSFPATCIADKRNANCRWTVICSIYSDKAVLNALRDHTLPISS